MKKYLAVFIAVTALASVFAYAEEVTDFKKCYKKCMEKTNDKEKCTYICDDSKP